MRPFSGAVKWDGDAGQFRVCKRGLRTAMADRKRPDRRMIWRSAHLVHQGCSWIALLGVAIETDLKITSAIVDDKARAKVSKSECGRVFAGY